MSDAEIKLGIPGATKTTSVGNVANEETKNAVDFYRNLSKGTLFDTGLLPLYGTGVLAIRQAMDHMQIVFQHEPKDYYINWGKHEGDGANGKAPTYLLAQPWRVVIGDFKDGALLGARTFYSPYPIQTGDQVMYCVNLPNINTTGYGSNNGIDGGGNCIGWLCLYLKDDWSSYTLDQKIRRLVERASGVETYNDGNMSSTDGPRFYEKWVKQHKPDEYKNLSYLWDPQEWAKKTAKDGYEWTLDENLWIPALVKDQDHQDKYDPKGQPLTLDMAMYGSYSAYYSDTYMPKPVNMLAREDLDDPTAEKIFETYNKAFLETSKTKSGAKTKKAAPIQPDAAAGVPQQPAAVWTPPVLKCPDCKIELPEGTQTFESVDGLICAGCNEHCYDPCVGCNTKWHYDQLQVWQEELWCPQCKTVVNCPNCGSKYDNNQDVVDGHCVNCSTFHACNNCYTQHSDNNLHQVQARASLADAAEQTFYLCLTCFEQSVKCGCGLLKNQETVGLLGDGNYACEPCIDYTNEGLPLYKKCEFIAVTPVAPKSKAKAKANPFLTKAKETNVFLYDAQTEQ